MKIIPEVFKKDGYTKSLLSRSGDLAVYKNSKDGFVGYELMRIRVRKKDRVLSGRTISVKGDEYLPSTNDWGSHGWSLRTLIDVDKKMAWLKRRDEALKQGRIGQGGASDT